MSDNSNHTPIQHLIDDRQSQGAAKSHHTAQSSEGEPVNTIAKIEINTSPETGAIKEVVEHEPSKEVSPFIGVRKETIDLPPDLKKMGLKPATATSFPSYQSVHLPISDKQVYQGLQEPISSSFRWLAELCLFFLKQAHLTLINIHGKIVRVIKMRL